MSFPAMAWAVRQKLPCTQKIVLMMLAERHNKDTGQCNPSHDLLADDCGLTRRSVMDQIAKLSEAGYLRIRHRAANNVKLPNQYILVFSFGVQEEVKDYAEVVNDVHQGSEPRSLGVVNDVHKGSEPVAHKPGTEPGIEPKDKEHKREPAPGFVLPDWIPADTWAAFMETRKAKKAKSTDYALKLIVNALQRLQADGHDPVEVLNNSIKAGWSDVYAPKPQAAFITGNRGGSPHKFAGAAQAIWGTPAPAKETIDV